MNKYEDILHFNYTGSKTRPKMSIYDRAAQFAPFSALTGFESAIGETGRLVDKKIELSEDEKQLLDFKIKKIVSGDKNQIISVVYFVKDQRKKGGKYEIKSGRLKAIDSVEKVIIFWDKVKIFIDDVLQIQSENIME